MFSPFVVFVGRVFCAPGPGSPVVLPDADLPCVPASSASVTLTHAKDLTFRCFRAGSLFLGVLFCSLTGCLAPAPHDDVSPTDITIPSTDEHLSQMAIAHYSRQLGAILKSASTEPTLNPAALHAQLKTRFAAARQEAFAPLDARLEQVMNQTPLDQNSARQLLIDLSHGFEIAGKAEKQKSNKVRRD